ncbi:hypothetical protein GUJ93_ZPchr0001g31688 [Zizania palustris]|uniref:Uncharacterized protein n=1 Tax=Zizania palustris TaxID=103762 RepID=A0A8J5RQK7_ZIZPA|nr:hypothetical protein GUJ93_ZPchr0001g31688 [Zizania palustris]
MKRVFVESSSSSNSGREAPAPAVLCAPRPRRVQVHPCSADLILGSPFLSSSNNKKQREGKSRAPEDLADDEDGSWALFGGSPPARADNPLVNDPHFLLNQRPTPPSSSSFDPSFAPAVRIQGFDVAACRSSHSSGGGRVLSARA